MTGAVAECAPHRGRSLHHSRVAGGLIGPLSDCVAIPCAAEPSQMPPQTPFCDDVRAILAWHNLDSSCTAILLRRTPCALSRTFARTFTRRSPEQAPNPWRATGSLTPKRGNGSACPPMPSECVHTGLGGGCSQATMGGHWCWSPKMRPCNRAHVRPNVRGHIRANVRPHKLPMRANSLQPKAARYWPNKGPNRPNRGQIS